MERKIVNPSKWQDALGFVQGHEATGAQRVLYCTLTGVARLARPELLIEIGAAAVK